MKLAKIFTHTDLDGVGSGIVTSKLHKGKSEIQYCDYKNIDKRVNDFLDKANLSYYSCIFITDISVNEKTAERLEATLQENPHLQVQLLDHHKTALWLNKYNWAHVQVTHENGSPASGTSLVVSHFEHGLGEGEDLPEAVYQFAEQVRRYDTWEWHTKYKEILPKELNDLLYMIGREDFAFIYSLFLERENAAEYEWFSINNRALLNQRQKEIVEYINKKEQQLIVTEDKVGHLFAENHISELGNEICQRHPEIDYICIYDIGAKRVSFRTVKDVDVSEVAKEIGGGGHAKAAGAEINDDAVQQILSLI